MEQGSQGEVAGRREQGKLFGIPVERLGFFSIVLIGAALAFAAFFAATFCGIVGIMIYNATTHHTVDYALSYERGGLVAGVVMLVAAWGFLGAQWVRRVTRH
jgi:uncharacterized membrane protein